MDDSDQNVTNENENEVVTTTAENVWVSYYAI